MSVNYHGLADFRVAHPPLLEALLSENIATLSMAGVINLDEVVQDGVRVRALAGASSFRRKKKLHKELRKAARLIERLKQETDDEQPADQSGTGTRCPRTRRAGGGGAASAGGD